MSNMADYTIKSFSRRSHERLKVRFPVAIDTGRRLEGRNYDIGYTVDVSPNGIKVVSSSSAAPGKDVFVRAILPSGFKCTTKGTVWRKTSQVVIIRFDHKIKTIENEFNYDGYHAESRNGKSLIFDLTSR